MAGTARPLPTRGSSRKQSRRTQRKIGASSSSWRYWACLPMDSRPGRLTAGFTGSSLTESCAHHMQAGKRWTSGSGAGWVSTPRNRRTAGRHSPGASLGQSDVPHFRMLSQLLQSILSLSRGATNQRERFLCVSPCPPASTCHPWNAAWHAEPFGAQCGPMTLPAACRLNPLAFCDPASEEARTWQSVISALA